jgi:two-component system CheB/CheR fusion protein
MISDLPIAKGLVELMNGKIMIESVVGKGTTVYFTIPYYPIMPLKNDIEPSNKQRYDWSDKTILLIEDDLFNVKLILKFLERTKAKYLVAYNGSSAIEMYRNNSDIDVLLLDIQLPDIDGYSVAKKLIEINPKAIIIAQTAYAFEENRSICYEAGCSDFIPKPLEREKFLETIDKYMKG